MAVDPTISLQAQAPQIDLASIFSDAMQLRQMRQQVQTGNALKTLFSQPGALDPKTGRPTTNALIEATRISPEYGQKLVAESSQAAEQQAQTAHAQSETQTIDSARHADELGSQLAIYDAALQSGNTSPDIAEQNLKAGIKDYIDSQPWSSDRKTQVWGTLSAMDPTKLRGVATQLSMTQAERKEAQERATTEAERTPYNMGGQTVFVDKTGKAFDAKGQPTEITAPLEKPEVVFDPQKAAATAENRAPTLLTDPDSGEQYWAYPGGKGEKPTYKTLSGDDYTPKGAAHIQSGVVRGGIAGAIQAAQTENQKEGKGPLSSDQIEQIAADYGRKTRSAVAFATGKQGDQVRFLNVAIGHLDTLEKYAEALKNGDVQTINRLKNGFETELGVPAPTNFKALGQIVSQEVHKGVAGVGGSASEREDLGKQADLAASPEQILGVITGTQKLLGTQAHGLKRQYETSTGLDDFDQMLSPRTREVVGMDADGETAPAKAKSADKSGGDSQKYKTATDVVAAYHAGRLSKAKAAQILRDEGWAQ